MREMNVGEVVSWLDEIDVGHLAPRFRENGVDGAFLADIIQQDLVLFEALQRDDLFNLPTVTS